MDPLSVGLSLASGLFGHHNDYPNGNPADLSKFDAIAQQAMAGDAASLTFLQRVAVGQQITNGPGSVWYNAGDHDNAQVNWGDPSPGRAAERAYAARLVAGMTGTTQPNPSAAELAMVLRTNAPPDSTLGSALTAIVQAGLGASESQLGTTLAGAGAALHVQGSTTYQRASTVPNITPTQLVLIVVGLVLVGLLFLRKKS
jgi:hypothetical protein